MRYRLIFLSLLLGLQLKAAVNMTTVRDLFATAAQNSEACDKLHAMTADASFTKDPVLYAYHAAAEIIRANHAFWPDQKLGHFNGGKAMLEAVIAKNPSNVELRYVRYCIQRGSPFFLGYSSNKATDRQYVLANIDKTGWSDAYKKKVRDFLNSSS